MDPYNTMKAGSIINAIVIIILGVLFLISPFGASEGMVLFAGAMLVIYGVISIVQFIASKGEEPHASGRLFAGLVMIGVGVFAYTHIGMGILLDVMALMIGVFIIVCGVTELDFSLQMRKAGTPGWVLNLVLSIIILIGGILMLIDPFEAIETTFVFVGMMLIMDGIFELVMGCTMKKID